MSLAGFRSSNHPQQVAKRGATDRCTCDMGGSYITSCPTHGVRETLIHDAERKLRKMTTPALRAFVEEPHGATDRTGRDEAIEVMAQASYEAAAVMCPGDDAWETWAEMDSDMREHWHEEAEAALDALLAPRAEPCETCGESGGIKLTAIGPIEVCPTCSGSGFVSRPALCVIVPGATVEVMAQVYARWRQGVVKGEPMEYYKSGPYAQSVRNARVFMADALDALFRLSEGEK